MSQTQRYADTSGNCISNVYYVFTYEIYGTGNIYIILQNAHGKQKVTTEGDWAPKSQPHNPKCEM